MAALKVFLKCYMLIYRNGDSKENNEIPKQCISKSDFDSSGT